jgi:hypothetical protein
VLVPEGGGTGAAGESFTVTETVLDWVVTGVEALSVTLQVIEYEPADPLKEKIEPVALEIAEPFRYH